MAIENRWTECSLGDAITLKRGYDLPKRDRVIGNYPIVSSSGVSGYHYVARVKGPGVVTGRYGTLGQVFYLQNDFWPLNTSLYVEDFKGNHPRFISFLLQTLSFEERSGAAAVPGVNRNHLHTLQIKRPDLYTQRKIAAILSAYDDLIENNLRRIKILEEMAQNLYREWFVKFRFPGHQNARFVDSPLGRIPRGWEIATLGKVANVIPGYAFKSKDWADTGIPVIKIKNIRPGNLIDTEQADHVPETILTSKQKKFWLYNGDILIAMTGATAGKVGKLRSRKPMLLNQRVAKIEPKINFEEFVWCSVSSPSAENRFYALADGAAQPNMSGGQIENSELLIPSVELVSHFNDLVSSPIRDVDNMILRNETLRRTRDLLLPKLISGEVDVSELDIAVYGETA